MATIRKINGKNGLSYQIIISTGRDAKTKRQIRQYKNWKPEANMTEKQADKAVQKIALEYEERAKRGFEINNRQTFAEYAERVIKLKELEGRKLRTIEAYRNERLPRINEEIGNMKIADIKPPHLNDLYFKLSSTNIRANGDKARAKEEFNQAIKSKGLTNKELSQMSGIALSTISLAKRGDLIKLKSAVALSNVLEKKLDTLFSIESDTRPLSSQTIIKYHYLLSMIFDYAYKEGIIETNPALRATPPKLKAKKAETLQLEQLAEINSCLENEDIKWRTIFTMYIATGCRRGELIALKWDDIDWTNRTIHIHNTLYYSKEKGVYENSAKTATSDRFEKLPESIFALLKEYQAFYYGLKLLNADNEHFNASNYVFVRDNGEPINPTTITQWISNFSKRNNLPHLNPHLFRHTYCSALIYEGHDIITISHMLGHSKASTTADIYSHFIQDAQARVADSIADKLLQKKA